MEENLDPDIKVNNEISNNSDKSSIEEIKVSESEKIISQEKEVNTNANGTNLDNINNKKCFFNL